MTRTHPDVPCAVAVSVLDHGVRRLPNLPEFLGCRVLAGWHAPRPVQAWIGWGLKRSGQRAARNAMRYGGGCWRLEDGFLRSVVLGCDEPPFSLVIDDLGIYYDATRASRLEDLVSHPLTEAERARASSLANAWRASRVSKYNHLREYAGELPARYVLVADQTFGDASIRYGLAGPASFERMLAAALEENPECTVLLKIHPDVFAGKKRGHFDVEAVSRNPRVRVLAEDVHPVRLIEHAEAVYVVTSQMGFEGLLWGKRVRTFGMPFYAGWGLTGDELPAPERRKGVQLENVVHAALVEYPRYIDPETCQRCEPERLIEWMGLQRRMRERFPAVVYAPGFSIYKRPIVRGFFQGSSVRFSGRVVASTDRATVAVWGRKGTPLRNPSPLNGEVEDGGDAFPTAAAPLPSASGVSPPSRDVVSPHSNPSTPGKGSQGAPRSEGPEMGGPAVVRLEDGFIRSVGLGADLIRPLSWVMDRRGIYYDATQPSDLEVLLQEMVFDEVLCARARALRGRLVAEGLTKYNVGGGGWRRPKGEKGPRVILVPGQVESDASLAYGAPGIRRNLDLLRAVREANSEGYVVYKPHPDVVAGLRRKGQGEDDAKLWCDEVVLDVGMGDLLPQVDEVHTLTSLAGFEALLRGKRVVCYGQPFYAGWGLTEDVLPPPRRSRRLTLDELVAGVLILYPTYVSRTTGRFTTPERALDELLAWRESGASTLPWWRKGLRWVLRFAKG